MCHQNTNSADRDELWFSLIMNGLFNLHFDQIMCDHKGTDLCLSILTIVVLACFESEAGKVSREQSSTPDGTVQRNIHICILKRFCTKYF